MGFSSIFLWLFSAIPCRYVASKCGHQTRRTGQISAFGRTETVRMHPNKEGSVDYCFECIGRMAIRCAWCSDPIFIGEPITLYSPRDGFQIPEHAVVYSQAPLQLVGCLGLNCSPTGADRAGFWLPGENGQGHVHRVQTVFEAMMSAEESSMALVSDTGDIAEAMNPTIIPLDE